MASSAIQHAYNERIWHWPKSLPVALQQGLVWSALAVVGTALIFRLWLHRRTRAAPASGVNGSVRSVLNERRRQSRRRGFPTRVAE